ncbi:hypothetical protein MBANPS3_012242 [Mucor bainieri]
MPFTAIDGSKNGGQPAAVCNSSIAQNPRTPSSTNFSLTYGILAVPDLYIVQSVLVIQVYYNAVPSPYDATEGHSKSCEFVLARDIMEAHGIYTSKKTQGGRKSGSNEAKSLEVPLDDIQLGDGWTENRCWTQIHYIQAMPSQFSLGLAGFRHRPFRLPRNIINPSKKLQRQVFPWIEGLFGEDNAEWRKLCDQEMDEYYPGLGDRKYDDNDQPQLIFVEEDGITRARTRLSARDARGTRGPIPLYGGDRSLRGFLCLLLRCRRVILQDAAMYLESKQHKDMLNLAILKSEEFTDF